MWGVGSYLGRKKAERVKKRRNRGEGEKKKGVLDPDPGLQSIK